MRRIHDLNLRRATVSATIPSTVAILLFALNTADAQEQAASADATVDYNNTICPSLVSSPAGSRAGGERLLREYTWRPRTIGMTFIFKK